MPQRASSPRGGELWVWSVTDVVAPSLTFGAGSVFHIAGWTVNVQQPMVDVSTRSDPLRSVAGLREVHLALTLEATERDRLEKPRQFDAEVAGLISRDVEAVVLYDPKRGQYTAFDGLALLGCEESISAVTYMSKVECTWVAGRGYTPDINLQQWRPYRQAQASAPPWTAYKGEEPRAERPPEVEVRPDARKPPRRVVRRDR